MLCKICQNIFPTLIKDCGANEPVEHHLTPETFLQSVREKCRICTVLWQNLSEEEKTKYSNSKVFEEEWCTSYYAGNPQISAGLNSTRDPRMSFPSFTLDFDIDDRTPSLAYFTVEPVEESGPLLRSTPLLDYTGSEEPLSQAKKWLSLCLNDHERCNTIDNAAWSPTRLLDIKNLKDDGHICLIQTKNQPVHGGYVTLSHCWGKSLFIRLLSSNIDEFCTSIVSSQLPKTFQDAMNVANVLGIRYIWIDALCIIQDSPGDWVAESADMYRVYRESICNIAASDSTDGSGGLFFQRETEFIEPLRFTCVLDGVPNTECVLTNGDGMWREELEKSPLYRRAWVFQEQLLAKRTLHFTRQQIVWECLECISTEIYTQGLPRKRLYPLMSSLRGLIQGERDVQPSSSIHTTNSDAETIVLEAWTRVIAQYTKCSLSFSKDKLVAISGIAQPFKERLGEYVAGLWKCYLPFELLWFCDRYLGLPVHRVEEYIAPSWSWASIKGPVSYLYIHQAYDRYKQGVAPWSSVSEVEVQLRPGSKFEVQIGSLRIRGRLALFSFTDLGEGYGKMDSIQNIGPDELKFPQLTYNATTTSQSSRSLASLMFDNIEDGQEQQHGEPLLFCMAISARTEPAHHVMGLVIQRVREDTFRRIGVFDTQNPDAHQAMERLDDHTITII